MLVDILNRFTIALLDPKDIELKKAIAQLLKEVADREEKRRHKQHHDSKEENSKESHERVAHTDINISIKHEQEHHKLKTSQDSINVDDSIENHDDLDDHVERAIDTIEDTNEEEFRSTSVYVDDNSKQKTEGFESTESDLDDSEDKTSHESQNALNTQESLRHDDHHDEKHINVHNNDHDGLRHKDNHHNHHRHLSKETIEEGIHVENSNINDDTLEERIDTSSVSEDRSEDSEHSGDSEKEAQTENENNHNQYSYESSDHHEEKQHDIDGEISHDDEKILQTEGHDDDHSEQDHGKHIITIQKSYGIQKDSQNDNSYEDISGQEDHDEENNYESDQIQAYEDYHESNSRLYSFENYDARIENDDDDDDEQQSRHQVRKIIDESSIDHDDFISRRNRGHSKEAKNENVKSNNDFSSNLNEVHSNEAVKDDVDHQDSIEIVRYRVPQRRHRSRENERIRKNYREASKKAPMKQYTLSFFLRK